MDFKEICRTCLLPSGSMESLLSSIRLPDSELPIFEILRIFTNISVFDNDCFPDKICYVCLKDIRELYTFKLKCEKSEAILIKQLKENARSISDEFKYYPETNIEIKTESIATLNDEQLEPTNIPEIFESDRMNHEITLIQEVKQEPELEIHMAELDFNDIGSREKYFKSDLNTQVQTTHDDGTTEQFTCTKCCRIFPNKRRLHRHMIAHAEERPEMCPKSFLFKNDLVTEIRQAHTVVPTKTHMTIDRHTKTVQASGSTKENPTENQKQTVQTEKKFKCELCFKTFHLKYYLTEHMNNHTGFKYQCKQCSRSYGFKNNLKRHIRDAHTDRTPKNNKNLKCEICSKLFRLKHHLKAHMRSHTGEKPFECELCKDKFCDKRNLNKHMQRVHGLKLRSNSNSERRY